MSSSRHSSPWWARSSSLFPRTKPRLPPAEEAVLATAKDRLADLDANLSEWQEILELAATFATHCGDAYRKASDRTRRQFKVAVFTRLDVKDGRLRHEEYRPPFDDIFNVPEFQYGTRERLKERES